MRNGVPKVSPLPVQCHVLPAHSGGRAVITGLAPDLKMEGSDVNGIGLYLGKVGEHHYLLLLSWRQAKVPIKELNPTPWNRLEPDVSTFPPLNSRTFSFNEEEI